MSILVENSGPGQQSLRLTLGWKCWSDDAREVHLCTLLRIASHILGSCPIVFGF